jgi:hypothetical protein
MNVFTNFFHFEKIKHYDTTFVEWKKGLGVMIKALGD